METHELLDSVHETFRSIEKRLAALETVHTRYSGPPGKPGKDAPPPRIVIGTVTSGDQADAKIRTADGTFFLDLCLPRGSDGRDGVDGVSNIPGPSGPRGCNGVDGRVVIGQVVNGHFAAATVRVENDVQIIDLVLPRGERGETGPQGETGPAGPQGISGRNGSDGKDSTVPGPAGARGEVGPQGQPGPRGDVPTTDELLKLIRSVIDENPERFRGPSGVPGRNGADGVGLRGPIGKPGDISAAVAQAEQEARNVVKAALAEIQARLERLERAKNNGD